MPPGMFGASIETLGDAEENQDLKVWEFRFGFLVFSICCGCVTWMLADSRVALCDDALMAYLGSYHADREPS